MKQIMVKEFRMWAILALLAMLLFLGGCSIVAEPSAQCAEKYWERDADDLQTMVQWLQNTGYQFFSFDRFDDFALADLEHVPLDELDETIRPTLERLFDKRYQVIILDREENSIQFEFWSNFQQQGCGLLYAIDPAKPARTQYMMQCEPLTEAQWYYYFTDANEWRVEQTRGAN